MLPRIQKFFACRKTIVAIFCQRFEQNALDVGRNAGLEFGRQRQGRLHLFEDHRQRGFGLERHAAGDHLIQHDAKRINIGTLIEFLALRLLRAHVRRSAGDRASGGELRRAFHQFGNAEIGEEHIAPRVDQHVGGFDVAVNDAALVSVAQRVGELGEQPVDLWHR